MRLASLTRPDLVFTDLPAADREEVLRALAARVAGRGVVQSGEKLFQKLWEREQLGSTGIGGGIAIPHCKLEGLRRATLALGLVAQGVEFCAADGKPVQLFLLVMSPSDSPADHLQVLAAISRWIKAGGHAEAILALHSPQAVYDLLQQEGG